MPYHVSPGWTRGWRERGSAPKRGRHSTMSFFHRMHLCSGSLVVWQSIPKIALVVLGGKQTDNNHKPYNLVNILVSLFSWPLWCSAGNHLSHTTCLTQVSSTVANHITEYGDPWLDGTCMKQTRLCKTSSVRQVVPPPKRHKDSAEPLVRCYLVTKLFTYSIIY